MTESEIQRSFRSLFRGGDFAEKDLLAAEDLVDQLPPESPLRTKLTVEIGELRNIVASKA